MKTPPIPDEAGLSRDAAVVPEKSKGPFKTQPSNLGLCLIPYFDNITEALERAEGPFYR